MSTVRDFFETTRPGRVQIDAADLTNHYLGQYVEVWHRDMEHTGHPVAVTHYRPADGSTARVVIRFAGHPDDSILDVPADAAVTVPEVAW
jgi:hypothetical protein